MKSVEYKIYREQRSPDSLMVQPPAGKPEPGFDSRCAPGDPLSGAKKMQLFIQILKDLERRLYDFLFFGD